MRKKKETQFQVPIQCRIQCTKNSWLTVDFRTYFYHFFLYSECTQSIPHTLILIHYVVLRHITSLTKEDLKERFGLKAGELYRHLYISYHEAVFSNNPLNHRYLDELRNFVQRGGIIHENVIYFFFFLSLKTSLEEDFFFELSN